jgi:hypothetical protein
MKTVPVILSLALVAGCQAATRNQQMADSGASKPVDQAEKQSTGPSAVTEKAKAWDDRRPISWAGNIGQLDEINWIVMTFKEDLMVARGGSHIQRQWILAIQKTDSGFRWIKTTSDESFSIADDGIRVVQKNLAAMKGEPAGDEARAPEAAGEKTIPFRPVPETLLAALRTAVENTPVPAEQTKTGEGMTSVEVSTRSRHVLASVLANLRPFVTPNPNPTIHGSSKDLGDMASRLAELYTALYPDG